MICLVLVKSGILKMNQCTLSLDGMTKETHKKGTAIVSFHNSSIEIFHCLFKGDTLNGSNTAGILSVNSDTTIYECSFAHFNFGAIMIRCRPENCIMIS